MSTCRWSYERIAGTRRLAAVIAWRWAAVTAAACGSITIAVDVAARWAACRRSACTNASQTSRPASTASTNAPNAVQSRRGAGPRRCAGAGGAGRGPGRGRRWDVLIGSHHEPEVGDEPPLAGAHQRDGEAVVTPLAVRAGSAPDRPRRGDGHH